MANTRWKLLMLVLTASLLGACAQNPATRGGQDWESVAVPVEPMPAATEGAVYRSNYGMSLFLDRRARQVGDVITITLQEKTDATKSSSTATAKDSSLELPGATVFGRTPTHNGTALFPTSVGSEQDFSGQGRSSQSNSLTGSITVTVSEVLANGSLRVRGEKWVTINQGEEFIRIKGIVRPEDIAADNTVPSYKVADARIAYSGRGTLADANSMGWLGRVFQSVLSPF